MKHHTVFTSLVLAAASVAVLITGTTPGAQANTARVGSGDTAGSGQGTGSGSGSGSGASAGSSADPGDEIDADDHAAFCDDDADADEAYDAEEGGGGSGGGSSGRSCAYSSCTVTCGTNSPGSGGSCHRGIFGCEIQMTQGACDLLGFKNGSTLPLPGGISHPLPPSQPPPSKSAVMETCNLRHEASHGCDGRGKSGPATEDPAYRVTIDCMQEAQKKYCADEASTAANKDVCDYLTGSLPRYWAALNYQTCKLNGSSPATCVEMCERNYPGTGDCYNTCTLYDPSTCPKKAPKATTATAN